MRISLKSSLRSSIRKIRKVRKKKIKKNNWGQEGIPLEWGDFKDFVWNIFFETNFL